MFTNIFYLIGVGFIFFEFLWVTNPLKICLFLTDAYKLYEIEKGTPVESWSDRTKKLFILLIFQLFMWMWLFLGLLSAQWIIFLAYIALDFIFAPIRGFLRKKIFFLYVCFSWAWSVIGMGFLVFVLLNHYHLHINLVKLFETYI